MFNIQVIFLGDFQIQFKSFQFVHHLPAQRRRLMQQPEKQQMQWNL
jgi:hypothetical protein